MVNEINLGEYFYIMNRIALWLVRNDKKFNTRTIYSYEGRVTDYGTVIQAIKDRGDNVELDGLIAEFVECAIYDNKDLSFLPNYVTCSDGKTKLYTNTFVDMANRVSAYEVLNGRSPSIISIKNENATNETVDTVLDEFQKHAGKVTCIDDCLEAIQGRGYAFYFDSQYNTHDTIVRVFTGKGANCTDIAQLLYRLALALGYDVQFVHVKCRVSGTGHVRLRLRKNNGDWFYRDGAAVLDGESITSNWCSDGYLIAYNPSWIFDDLYQ